MRAIRAGASPEEIARRYLRRDQGGRRVEAVATFLSVAATSQPHSTEAVATLRALNVGCASWWVDGGRSPGQPQRNLRTEAITQLEYAAMRVARRGAGRCAQDDCAQGRGAKLSSSTSGDHCAEHAWMDGVPRRFVECDRAFFNALLPAVLDKR